MTSVDQAVASVCILTQCQCAVLSLETDWPGRVDVVFSVVVNLKQALPWLGIRSVNQPVSLCLR